MTAFKRVLVLILVGAVLGDVVATLLARSLITWYWTPGSLTRSAQQLCTVDDFRNIISSLIKYQLIGALVGALVFAVAGSLALRNFRKPKPDATAPSSP